MRAQLLACAVGIAALALTNESKAQEVSAVLPPDIILLSDGGMVRGTISEMTPGAHVVIITATGEARQFDMADVKYAGPASQAESSTKPESEIAENKELPADNGGARVTLTASQPTVTFHRRTSHSHAIASGAGGIATARAASYEDLCTAPCEVRMQEGSYAFALSLPGRKPVDAETTVYIPSGTSQVVGEYTLRSGVRTAGWIIVGASIIVGAILVFTSEKEICDEYGCESEPNGAQLIGGTALALIGTTVGIIMGVTDDKVSVRVLPQLRTSSLKRRPEAAAMMADPLGGSVLGPGVLLALDF